MSNNAAKIHHGVEDCGFDDALLLQYLAHEAEASQTQRVEQHLLSCKTCREILATMAMEARLPMAAAEQEAVVKSMTFSPDMQMTMIQKYIEADLNRKNKLSDFIREAWKK